MQLVKLVFTILNKLNQIFIFIIAWPWIGTCGNALVGL